MNVKNLKIVDFPKMWAYRMRVWCICSTKVGDEELEKRGIKRMEETRIECDG